ncbi:MotA/TolQ/ExbB proton channel family protein [Actomonas aquatica]|uniref:MotA/TolQ/ExbB proton channel family protein n=1 Tax=Actomonas aquatica TaxID=2866162 RepID=A0ABZ1C5Y9_9BACT|nr:MotA/TolQ/ExbB proton channel family protein [Opitutus sp. WL0086]WRQ87147.1 MotA/TolQ/ExbB proton channel family protein [Opitutus sp. WL0086]
MRSLLSSGLVAVVTTAVLLLILHFTLPAEAWFRAFLFERSPVQWLSIAMFVFGADILVRKARRLSREQADLSAAAWQDYPETTGSWVRRRIAALFKLSAQHSPSFCREAARDLSDEDTQALNDSYTLPADVIGLLPLVGFFGTVWGLSAGLYNNFVLQGEDSTDSFANAIGTAFDTTLLALFLTITLSIAQSLLRRAEQTLLGKLDRHVESALLKVDATGSSPVPASNDPRVWLDELGIDPAELISYFRQKLGTMATDLAALSTTNEKLTAAIAELNTTTASAAAATADRPAPPDPTPQLTALVTATEAATAAARAQLDRLSALQASFDQTQAADATAREQHLAALTDIAAKLEAAREQATSAQADLRAALEQGHGQLSQTVTAASEDITAQLKLAAQDQAAALAALQEATHAADQRTHDLLTRPKSFTITEGPARDHDAKA